MLDHLFSSLKNKKNLQIRWGSENNSEIIFLTSQSKHAVITHQNRLASKDGSQHVLMRNVVNFPEQLPH